MRNLTAEEWMIVSGGHPSEQDGGLQEVTVNGQRHSYRDPFSGVPWILFAQYWAHVPYGMRPADYHDDQGGGGGEEPETPRDTPCVTDKPTKHGNILDIHQGAIDLKKEMPSPPHSLSGASYEYFGIIYKSPDGSVRTTVPVTSNESHFVRASAVWTAIDDIPDGAIILGIWHSQPDSPTMSSYDWAAHKSIFNNPDSPSMIARKDSVSITESLGRGITADPNGLSYVYDMKTGKIHVYDKSDMDSDKVQCHVNNQTGG